MRLMNMRKGKNMRLSLTIFCLLTLASAASAEDRSANNMPTVNPWLHDSITPISHENPAQTDAVDIASGTNGRNLRVDDAKVLYIDSEASHHVLKNIDDKQVAYFSGAGLAINKVDITVRTLS